MGLDALDHRIVPANKKPKDRDAADHDWVGQTVKVFDDVDGATRGDGPAPRRSDRGTGLAPPASPSHTTSTSAAVTGRITRGSGRDGVGLTAGGSG